VSVDRNQEATCYLVRSSPSSVVSRVADTLESRQQGNLDERCTDALVWELMLQAGPVGSSPPFLLFLSLAFSPLTRLVTPLVNVHLPKDRISMTHQGYGFCEFLTEEDAEYACKIMNQIKLYGKPIRVNKVSSLPPVDHLLSSLIADVT
jgi:splicing factor 3B subunit 4